jgi:hypothetical protein
LPTEHAEGLSPYIEWTGEECLSDGKYSVLEIDEDKAIGAGPKTGLVYVVERKGKPGRRLAYLTFIPPNDLRLRRPHPTHPVFRKHTILRTDTPQDHCLGQDRKPQ